MYLLDTVILVWLANKPREIEPKLTKLLRGRNMAFFASRVSFWEIANKQRAGRLNFGINLPDAPAWLADNGISILHLEFEHIVRSMDFAIDDPFDRLLYATADVEGLKLLTSDENLLRLPLALDV
jgi:PIN domain nuclease of toxin-antitoxin system